MGKVKGIEKVVKAEDFDFKYLKKIMGVFNESGALGKKLKMVPGGKDALVERFILGVEDIAEGSEEEKKIPKTVMKLYNGYVDVIDDKNILIGVTSDNESDIEGGTPDAGKGKGRGKGKKAGKSESKGKKENKKEGGDTICKFVVSGIKSGDFKGKSNSEIAEVVKKKFNSNTKAHNIGWYKWKVKKGEL